METKVEPSLLPENLPDWAPGAVYQIVVPSFMDSNGDGWGDLPGIISRLDYLQWLGASALWLSPIYSSPLLDMGYDVSNYTDVNPRFGTLADFDRLLEEAHRRDLHIVLDFVPNHTSDRHPWFQSSKSSRNDPRRDWYIWRNSAPGGGPPNNWNNQYEQSDWTWDEATGQYYMHSFMPEQPDLNWANGELRAAMGHVLRFWLDRGVDGFRIDAMVHLYKDPLFRDNPPTEDSELSQWPDCELLPAFSQDVGGLQEIVREICGVVREYPGTILIGENHLPPERLPMYYCSGLTHPANSQLLDLKWDALQVRRMIDRYEGFLTPKYWPNWILGSHDNERVASALGLQRARVAAMMQLTLRGTPIMYYGEEIGMHNVDIPDEEMRDQLARRLPGKRRGRDYQRTPMQWSSKANAGFTTGEPWLPVAADYEAINVDRQRDEPRSMLNLYRKLLMLRISYAALRTGRYLPGILDERALVYVREGEGERILVVLNFTGSSMRIRPRVGGGRLLASSYLDQSAQKIGPELTLRANEGVMIQVEAG
jgi:alpha-glucosidase